ncbi:MAG: hypothetical protein ABRQ38_18380 [Candidatus Eremiobacterota bacterium]
MGLAGATGEAARGVTRGVARGVAGEGLWKTSLRSPVKEKDPEPEDVVSIGNSEKLGECSKHSDFSSYVESIGNSEKPDIIFKLKDFAAQHEKEIVNGSNKIAREGPIIAGAALAVEAALFSASPALVPMLVVTILAGAIAGVSFRPRVTHIWD